MSLFSPSQLHGHDVVEAEDEQLDLEKDVDVELDDAE